MLRRRSNLAIHDSFVSCLRGLFIHYPFKCTCQSTHTNVCYWGGTNERVENSTSGRATVHRALWLRAISLLWDFLAFEERQTATARSSVCVPRCASAIRKHDIKIPSTIVPHFFPIVCNVALKARTRSYFSCEPRERGSPIAALPAQKPSARTTVVSRTKMKNAS